MRKRLSKEEAELMNVFTEGDEVKEPTVKKVDTTPITKEKEVSVVNKKRKISFENTVTFTDIITAGGYEGTMLLNLIVDYYYKTSPSKAVNILEEDKNYWFTCLAQNGLLMDYYKSWQRKSPTEVNTAPTPKQYIYYRAIIDLYNEHTGRDARCNDYSFGANALDGVSKEELYEVAIPRSYLNEIRNHVVYWAVLV